MSVSVVPVCPGIDICRSCRFIASLLSALGSLLGGFARSLVSRFVQRGS